MGNGSGCEILSDAVWAVWEPLIEEVRPRGKTPPKELRRTISAIFWRHQNGAKWRSIPADPLPGDRDGIDYDIKGLISAEWLAAHTPAGETTYYLCGPRPFLRDLTS